MVAEVIEVYDVYRIYLAEVREQSCAVVYMWKCMRFLKLSKSYFVP